MFYQLSILNTGIYACKKQFVCKLSRDKIKIKKTIFQVTNVLDTTLYNSNWTVIIY